MKQIIPNYTFNASNGQITFTDFASIDLERVLLVTNVTDGVVIYQFQKPGKLGSVAGNVLDLQFDTSSMSNGDDLQIIYHCIEGDPEYNEVLPVSGPLTDTELRATPVPVSGTITAVTSGLTDAELRATPVPVSGTVTANAGTNLNTSALALESGGNLAAIKAKTDNIPALGQALAAGSVPIVLTAAQLATLTPPAAITGFATSANQSTEIASLATIAGAIKAEDAAHVSGDSGIPALAVRSDSDTPLAADGDYIPIVTNQFGRVKASVLPAATAITTGTITTGTGTVSVDTARQSGATLQITGTFTVLNAIFEGSLDGGTTWKTISAARTDGSSPPESTIALAGAPSYFYKISANNLTNVRIRATSFTGTSAGISFMPTAFASDPTPAIQRNRRDSKTQQTTTLSATTEATILTAVAGTYLDLYGLIIANTSATPSEVTIRDATAGTVRISFYVPAGSTVGFMLPSNDGYAQSAVNNNWTAQAGTSVSSIKVTAFALKVT